MSKTLTLRKILLAIGDVALLYISLVAMVFFAYLEDFNRSVFLDHFYPFNFLHIIWLLAFYVLGFYELNIFNNKPTFYSRFFGGILISLITGMIFFYIIPSGVAPKTNLLVDLFIFIILALFWRSIFHSIFSSYFQNKIVVIGSNPQSQKFAESIKENPQFGYKLSAVIPIDSKDIGAQIENKKIDTLVLAEDLEPNTPAEKNIYRFLPLKADFMDLSRAYEIIFGKIPVKSLNQVWFLENFKGKKFYDHTKKMMDVFLSIFFLLITLPLWIIIVPAIKISDKGPVFYRQERMGKNKEKFLLIKFRSMEKDAEKHGPKWAEKEDPRITKVGKVLRKIHLDELPQLINILKGDISLIGPRPERPEFVENLEEEIPYYHLRHLIKPGFTGWAQINFRYSRSVEDSLQKFQYDLYYIKNRSLMLDIQILLKTFSLFFKEE